MTRAEVARLHRRPMIRAMRDGETLRVDAWDGELWSPVACVASTDDVLAIIRNETSTTQDLVVEDGGE